MIINLYQYVKNAGMTVSNNIFFLFYFKMSMLLHNIVKCENLSEEEDEMKMTRVCLNSLVSVIIGAYAISLSFSSNAGVAMPLRIVYALFAGLFGIFYLMYYFFVVYLSKVFKKYPRPYSR